MGPRKHKDLKGQEHAGLQHPGHFGQDAKGVKGEAVDPRRDKDLKGHAFYFF